jgi:pimeloyl-ACP methyl ester carboxylesterase
VSIDLRGHGESDAPEQKYSILGFADDIAWICDQVGIEKPLVVGHSMGGAVALSLAVRHPGLPSAIVLLDPAILFRAEAQPLITQLVAGFRSPDGARIMREFAADRMYLKTSDPQLKERNLDAACRTPMHVVASAFVAIGSFDAEAALRTMRRPVLYVEADPVVIGRVDRLRELCPDVVTGKTVGAGHFHQLEVPEQINAMIERFMLINGL